MLSNTKRLKTGVIKKVRNIILIVFVAFSLLSIVSSALAFNIIFQRRFGNPFDLTMEYTQSDSALYPRKDIEFLSGNHLLKGYIYGKDNSNGIIIVVNGFNASTTSHLAEIFYFVDEGWSVLSFEGTGVGNSSGKNVIGLEQTRKDVLAAIDFVENCDFLSEMPILLYGHSTGGYAVATLCNDCRISAAVCISAFNSSCSLMRHYAKKYAGFAADITYPYMCLYDWLLFGADANINAEKCLQDSTMPIMIVQGSEDEIIPYEESLYCHCSQNVNNNSNLELVFVNQDYRNHHSTIWLDSNAAKVFNEYSDYEADALSCYDIDDCPADIINELKKNADDANRVLRNVNVDFLNDVSLFFLKAVNDLG